MRSSDVDPRPSGWSPETLQALDSLRQDRIQVVLVTGRTLAALHAGVPGLFASFDAVVAENLCVLQSGELTRTLADPVPDNLSAALGRKGVPFAWSKHRFSQWIPS